MCLVCGRNNPYGLKAFFYELDNGELVSVFTPCNEHQGYPGRLHGGLAAAVLDETIGRAIMMKDKKTFWGVTVEITARFKKPIPLNVELRVVGRIEKESTRIFEGTGEIILPDGSVGAVGSGKYIKLPLGKITDMDFKEEEWEVVSSPDDPREFNLGLRG